MVNRGSMDRARLPVRPRGLIGSCRRRPTACSVRWRARWFSRHPRAHPSRARNLGTPRIYASVGIAPEVGGAALANTGESLRWWRKLVPFRESRAASGGRPGPSGGRRTWSDGRRPAADGVPRRGRRRPGHRRPRPHGWTLDAPRARRRGCTACASSATTTAGTAVRPRSTRRP
jgi:hypothetical protein